MVLQKAQKWLLNLIFQPKCIFCGEILKVSVDLFVCEKCAKKLPYVGAKICQKCGSSLDTVYGNNICFDCRNTTRYFDSARAPFLYEKEIKHIIVKFKFYRFHAAADPLGYYMAQKAKAFDGIDWITYVPLSKREFIKRGYNQAEILAKSVAKHLNLQFAVKELLCKVGNNQVQSHLSMKDRIKNVKGVFSVIDGIDLSGKTILLVDDVMTTGATLNECSKQLRLLGAKCVYAVTAAVSAYERY